MSEGSLRVLNVGQEQRFLADKGGEDGPGLLFNRVTEMLGMLRIFPDRIIETVAPDESNTFRCLCCFVRPVIAETIPTADTRSGSPFHEDQTARAYEEDRHSHDDILPAGVTPHRPDDLAFMVALLSDGIQHQKHFTAAQINSPAHCLLEQHGRPIELAIMLCDLFLGIGSESYVCIGHGAQENTRVWVVVLERQEGRTNVGETVVGDGTGGDMNKQGGLLEAYGYVRHGSIVSSEYA